MTQKGRSLARRVAPRNCPEAKAWVRAAMHVLAAPAILGLCYSIDDDSTIVEASMKRRVEAHLQVHPERYTSWRSIEPDGSYAYPRHEEREARVLACLWMALEAAEEER